MLIIISSPIFNNDNNNNNVNASTIIISQKNLTSSPRPVSDEDELAMRTGDVEAVGHGCKTQGTAFKPLRMRKRKIDPDRSDVAASRKKLAARGGIHA